jgi:hypothetical protein
MYVRDGPIAECSLEAKAGKEIEKQWYFLFNDSLVITDRKKDDKYQFQTMVDFTNDSSMKFKDVPDNSGMFILFLFFSLRVMIVVLECFEDIFPY